MAKGYRYRFDILASRHDFESRLERFLAIKNKSGGRGYGRGVLVFDCPFCGDKRARGWVNLEKLTAGCFNDGCEAKAGMSLGNFMRKINGSSSFYRPPMQLPVGPGDDVTIDKTVLPEPYFRLREYHEPSVLLWAMRKWHCPEEHILLFDPGVSSCESWRRRIIFPVFMHGNLVGYSGRYVSYDEAPTVKWKHSRYGVECIARASEWVYGIDSVSPGDAVILLEGIGDVIGFSFRAATFARPLAIFGCHLSSAQLGVICSASPGVIYVGLDNDARDKSEKIASLFRSLGYRSEVVTWYGGKDAGEGEPVISGGGNGGS